MGRHHRSGRADKTSTGNTQAPNEVTIRPTGWCAFDVVLDRPTDPLEGSNAGHTRVRPTQHDIERILPNRRTDQVDPSMSHLRRTITSPAIEVGPSPKTHNERDILGEPHAQN